MAIMFMGTMGTNPGSGRRRKQEEPYLGGIGTARHTSLVFVTLSPQGPLNPVEFAFPFKSRGTTKGSRRRGKSEGGKEGARCQRKNQIIVRIKRRSRNDVSPLPPLCLPTHPSPFDIPPLLRLIPLCLLRRPHRSRRHHVGFEEK